MKKCRNPNCKNLVVKMGKHLQYYCCKKCMHKHWAENHKDRIKEIHDVWLSNNPERRKEQCTRYERKMGKIPREEWYKIMPRGEKHVWWRGGTTRRVDKPEWKKIRYMVWKRDSFMCQLCNQRVGIGKKPIAHHRIPYELLPDDNDGNLITLCNSCHTKVHWKIRKEGDFIFA